MAGVPPLKASLVPRWRAENVRGCASSTVALRDWLDR
jgi:hypothetical protein